MTIHRKDLDAGRVDLSGSATGEALPPIHPGEILRDDWLIPLGISPYQLAKEIQVPTNRVTGIIKGTRAITLDTAIRLGIYFGTDARSWLNLQTGHDMAIARHGLVRRIEAEVKRRLA